MPRRLAIVTGGTSGIGLGVAHHLLPHFDLALIYSRDADRAEIAKSSLLDRADLKNIEFKVKTYAQDLNVVSEIPTLLRQISTDFTLAPSVLVNSAGRLRDGLFQTSKIEDHEALLREHVLAPMALCQGVVKGMSGAKFGRILNLSSISSDFAKRGQTNYAAAKGAIESFTRTLALEVAHRGVTVNAIAPGLIETPMTQNLIEKINDSEKGVRSRIPAGRYGTPDDIGALCAFLCSENASYITGQTIIIDGGRSLGDSSS